MGGSAVTLDFSKAQPLPQQDVTLDFSKAQPIDNSQSEPGYWEGLRAGAEGLVNAVRHPIDTITAMGKQVMAGGSTPYGTPLTAPTGNQQRDEANQAAQLSAQDEAAKQGQFMGQHPAYAAGQLTPAIAATAVGEAVPRIAPAIARGAGKALLLGKTPEGAYESALKPSTTLSQADRASIVKTGLQNSIPVSKAGLEDIGNQIEALNQAIKDQIASDPNRPIDPNAVATRTNDTAARFSNQVNATPDLQAIKDSRDLFLREQGATPGNPAPPMGAAQAQAMKQGTYSVLKGKFGEQGSAAVEAQKALARGLKEEIANQFPEISNLNAQESKLLDLQPVLERAVNRISNHQLIGIGTPVAGAAAKAVTGSGSVGVVASAMKAVLDNPMVKSRLAIAVSKGAKIPYAQAAAKVGAYSSALGSYADATQGPSGDQTPSQ